VRNLTLRILENAGYTVIGASDGEEALRLFQDYRNAISLVLLDAIMPKMTGREVYRRIKAEHPEMKVVFCSGYDPKTAPADFISQENLRLINKPFTDNTLLRTVRETLDEEMPCQLAIPSTT
jgi:CheY-like chemotaxis protein